MSRRNMSGHCDLTVRDMFCFESGGWRLLLYLTFCIYLVGGNLYLSGKSQGILQTDVCGNHDYGLFTCIAI